jgi:hypothetical protein
MSLTEYYQLSEGKIIHSKNFYSKVETYNIVDLKQINRHKTMRAIFFVNTNIRFTFKDGRFISFDQEAVDKKKYKVFLEEILKQSKLEIIEKQFDL